MTRRLQLYVSGRVQGVGYRWFVRGEAESLGLAGWVRNLSDGRVEVVAEGPEQDLLELARRCKRGPSGSRVTDVHESWSDAQGDLVGFRIAR